ncbi:UDP-2,3-diacylglucosamine hydrolase [Polaribacter reichenbachii]|uniref:UDP-2,3-diacylglucosamine hydrolase n=1 Tax=Polaribacter reichenbachii TaxID=996801 RepID=A0A1B8TPQ3_9FLAO|nr:UDP-2,3-diacylglucosamine diphosphatase [Polaribacter reichenbachii]APZ46881.1 UDP-2,3-diacylglucosamine hydrolase [Polaribacter reichenbachii]AUC17524.1 UDP-2,3-diacylglucosamine hydrolase [Polaribacter reichenbachii]OBY61602.1 UDP-2,3-diacylglucosamine hydrolase [Polaribacter reichenbachii]
MKKTKKRKVELVVISDIHLGTYGCRAKEVLNYLKTIQAETLILNGDIIDIWQFKKRFFPKSHMNVIKHITSLLSKETKVYYITGNHDEMLRKFRGFQLGNFKILNKIILNLDGKKAWIFHGDVFDVTMKHSKWLAKLGGKGYDLLIVLNTFINWVSQLFGYGKLSLSKKIKNSVKSAVKFINDFEKTASDIAIDNNYDYVICGHIHQPEIRKIKNQKGETLYLNSGDWIENLTALEYNKKEWSLYEYAKDEVAKSFEFKDTKKGKKKDKEKEHTILFNELLKEFDITNT